jgi:hypothetical protein
VVMNAEEQLALWREGPKDDGVMPEPIASVKEENAKAVALAAQLAALATYTVDEEKEKRREQRTKTET